MRHYRRGGWIARLSHDRYAWVGAGRTRSFAEWRLLAGLRQRGLPVPAPVAARYVREALTYRADVITEQLPATRTLADAITGATLPPASWRAVGRTVAQFHRHGVQHADLNAHNILLGAASAGATAPAVYLIDFDRGRLRSRGAWEAAVLARLRRCGRDPSQSLISLLEVTAVGRVNPRTRSLPMARQQRTDVTAESIPPETPMTIFSSPLCQQEYRIICSILPRAHPHPFSIKSYLSRELD